MITYRSEPGTDVVELIVEGRVDKADIDYALQRLDNDIARCGKVRVLEVIGAICGVEPAALWEDLLHAPKLLPHVSRAAVVSDQGWVAGLAQVAAPLIGKAGDIQTFSKAELDRARTWVAQP